MIRFLDILFSTLGLLLLFPFFIIFYLLIVIESPGGGFYTQVRVGKNEKDFFLYKFRSMRKGSDKKSLITIGNRDNRMTRVGYFIRKFKIDELPQLYNVLKGDMSLVGPRPEVRKYVEFYNQYQKKVLSVRPGITDYASIEYADENTLLGESDNPEKLYIEQILPHKIDLNMKYINNIGVKEYFKIIILTVRKIFI
ncbi:MAG: sugar transferase [Paludibacter sp.]|jgi:lipopolysaccharide/colanic/teichoic acid biosynthesis glycosyltransferase|nr:sugar transferase [Paludibacter sp.]